MPISGVSASGANYPMQPPPSAAPAYSCLLLDQLADISNTLASQGTEGASGVSAYSCALLDHLSTLSTHLIP